ncbi:hypothetical protein [Salinigranum rubrum]|uniref:hypothetical protein n=1 Tax=Salinigranum rubrum TaxID=755307 RepID=UPI001C1FD9C9|nr:hypothetical protein [Salinigranum rubrum]
MTTTAPRTPPPPHGPRRWTAVLLVVLLCAVSLVPLTAVASGGTADAEPALSARSVPDVTVPPVRQIAAQSNGSTTNESGATPVRHRDPRGLSEQGDLSELEQALADLLVSDLNESSVAIDRGEYDRARSIIGDRYDAVLERYVRVTRETPEQRDDTEQFRSTRDEQSAFVDTVRTYRERRTEYDRAKQDGDEGRARELARELNTLAAEAEQRSERLSREYDALGAGSGRDFSVAKQSVSDVQQNISAEQAVIRETEFVETSISVTDVGGGGSFVDPVVVSGTVVDENGTLLANRTVRIAINGTNAETETDGNATFSVLYRPVTDGLGEQNLTVEYAPRVDSIYLGSQTTASAVIRQNTPTLAIDDATTRARFGDRVVVSGTVAVNRHPAAGVPLNVSVDDVVVGQVTSDDLGAFRFEGTLPAAVDSGAQQLSVAYPFENRALAPNRTTTPITVGPTRTSMTVDGRQAALESLAISGRLLTADGRPVPGQPVYVFIAGRRRPSPSSRRLGAARSTPTSGSRRPLPVAQPLSWASCSRGTAPTSNRLARSSVSRSSKPVREAAVVELETGAAPATAVGPGRVVETVLPVAAVVVAAVAAVVGVSAAPSGVRPTPSVVPSSESLDPSPPSSSTVSACAASCRPPGSARRSSSSASSFPSASPSPCFGGVGALRRRPVAAPTRPLPRRRLPLRLSARTNSRDSSSTSPGAVSTRMTPVSPSSTRISAPGSACRRDTRFPTRGPTVGSPPPARRGSTTLTASGSVHSPSGTNRRCSGPANSRSTRRPPRSPRHGISSNPSEASQRRCLTRTGASPRTAIRS